MKQRLMKIATFCFALLFASHEFCSANTTKDVFAKYPNKYFIETGSYVGNGIEMALQTGQYEKIYSIELSPKYFEITQKRFKDNPKVQVVFGDSAKILGEVIAKLDAPATFWLDGHCSYDDTAKGDTMTALMRELEAIKNHPIKQHTILIDDVREFGTKSFDYLKKEDAIAKLFQINSNYSITYEDGHIKNDVLVAYIKQ